MSLDLSLLAKSALPDEAAFFWDEFHKAYRSSCHKEFRHPKASSFLKIFGNSRFLARFAIRHPETILPILNSPYLENLKPFEAFFNEVQALTTQPDCLPRFKKYKYQELLRITIKDLQGKHDRDVLNELSSLAVALIRNGDSSLYQESQEKWGPPLKKNRAPCSHHILALGKLGGYELNYSSDVDLISFYETDEAKTDQYEAHEFFTRHTQALTHFLQGKDEHGFLYRVDWDLRPEGKAGTLCNSLPSLEAYYESFGAHWERQALTKSLALAGSLELGHDFIRMITPFVYRKHMDLEGIREIKKMAEKIQGEQNQKKSRGFNVKLGVGGIRSIEFFVQSLLLLYGGKDPAIRGTGTLNVLEKLAAGRYVHAKQAQFLTEAYLFLRRVEHGLQMEDEAQTHTVPPEDKEQIKLALRLGYSSNPEEALTHFRSDLRHHTEKVHRIFTTLFSAEHPESPFYVKGEVRISPEVKMREELHQIIEKASDFEEKLDVIRLFKKEKEKEILDLENKPSAPRQDILLKLSLLATAICQEALTLAIEELTPRYGKAVYRLPQGVFHDSHLLVLAAGKLGGFEIGYASDLDVIFIYSEDGETTGPKIISNPEYFARLAQKLISILSVPTRAGCAYQVDTELRPSGHSGALVISLDSFMNYQKESALPWERQALLRARPIAGSAQLSALLSSHLESLLYSGPPLEDLRPEMHRLRLRVENELAKENERYLDYKLGSGGVMDIEFIVQYFQLLEGYRDLRLRKTNTFDILNRIVELNLLGDETGALALKEAYTFYRTLESKIALQVKRGLHRLQWASPLWSEVAPAMEFKDGETLKAQYASYRKKVREVYLKVFNPHAL